MMRLGNNAVRRLMMMRPVSRAFAGGGLDAATARWFALGSGPPAVQHSDVDGLLEGTERLHDETVQLVLARTSAELHKNCGGDILYLGGDAEWVEIRNQREGTVFRYVEAPTRVHVFLFGACAVRL